MNTRKANGRRRWLPDLLASVLDLFAAVLP